QGPDTLASPLATHRRSRVRGRGVKKASERRCRPLRHAQGISVEAMVNAGRRPCSCEPSA
ncbi:MAG: hypothetical protein J7M25_02505, partial [Deltaproteobacteria bacterium]|nr:hypothetical protein [Deltaproteobacteria bacterium]